MGPGTLNDLSHSLRDNLTYFYFSCFGMVAEGGGYSLGPSSTHVQYPDSPCTPHFCLGPVHLPRETFLSLFSAWTPGLYPPWVWGVGGVHSQALSMVPLVNPGPIYSGAIRACHLYVLIYDMGGLLPISEPHFGWLLQKKKRKYIECCHWLLKGSAHMTVLAPLDRVRSPGPAPLN